MRDLAISLSPVADRVRLRQQQHWDAGERILLETLLPGEREVDIETLLDLIYAEVLLREEHGERPSLEEYQCRFPHLIEALRRQFEFHQAVSSVSDLVGEESAKGETTVADVPSPRTCGSLPSRIGSYEILGEIGRGGMGVVYKARHALLSSRLSALKVIRPVNDHEAEEIRRRWATEGLALAALDHPNIVRMYEIEWAEVHGEQTPIVAMEFVVGGSLAERVNGTPLPPREAAMLLLPLADAVAHAHGRGIVHRDLKPANILLEPLTGIDATPPPTKLANARPRIADFGLAKRQEDDSGRTRSGAILGTPSYMAPEQAAGRIREVGPPADIYALGAILYECLTGRPPFKADTVLNTLEHVVSIDPVAPSKLQPGIPADLETICLKCLEKETKGRYPTAGALAEDLARFCDGRPILARPAGLVERTAKWVRRHPAATALWSVTALSIVALVALWVFFTLRLGEEKRNALAQRDEAVRQRTEAQRQEGIARRQTEEALRQTEEARLQSERAARLLASSVASVDNIAMTVRSAKREEVASGNAGSVLFKLACSYAKTSAALGASDDLILEDRTRLADQYALSAVRLLRCAEQLGYFDPRRPANRQALQTARELDSLRERADFKSLLAELR